MTETDTTILLNAFMLPVGIQNTAATTIILGILATGVLHQRGISQETSSLPMVPANSAGMIEVPALPPGIQMIDKALPDLHPTEDSTKIISRQTDLDLLRIGEDGIVLILDTAAIKRDLLHLHDMNRGAPIIEVHLKEIVSLHTVPVVLIAATAGMTDPVDIALDMPCLRNAATGDLFNRATSSMVTSMDLISRHSARATLVVTGAGTIIPCIMDRTGVTTLDIIPSPVLDTGDRILGEKDTTADSVDNTSLPTDMVISADTTVGMGTTERMADTTLDIIPSRFMDAQDHTGTDTLVGTTSLRSGIADSADIMVGTIIMVGITDMDTVILDRGPVGLPFTMRTINHDHSEQRFPLIDRRLLAWTSTAMGKSQKTKF